MQFITTTELRTKSSLLIQALQGGQEVSLIHRSRLVGRIRPDQDQSKLFNADKVKKIVEELNLEPTNYEEREKRYRAYLEKRYGKGLS